MLMCRLVVVLLSFWVTFCRVVQLIVFVVFLIVCACVHVFVILFDFAYVYLLFVLCVFHVMCFGLMLRC